MEYGQVMLPLSLNTIMNRGKFEAGTDGQPKRIIKAEL